MSRYILVEYSCDHHGRFESLEERPAPSARPCSCGATAERAVSAVRFKTQMATVTRGKPEEPPPGALDTRPLAEGQSLGDWKRRRREARVRARYDQAKAAGAF